MSMSQWMRVSPILLCLALLPSCAGKQDLSEDGGGMQSTDGGEEAPPCGGGCGEGQLCMNGACVALPKNCPCPKESYCNLASNMCMAGCLEDAHCATGRICDTGARQCKVGCRNDAACGAGRICDKEACRAGCRKDGDCGANELCDPVQYVCKAGCTSDEACGMGQICEALRCKVGCRMDTGCPMGQICESQKCRAGCRTDMDCPMSAMCVKTPLTCATCDADPDEAMDTTLTTSGRSVSQRVTRVLCRAGDVDRITWRQGPPNPGYYRYSEWVTVSGASASAVTTVKLMIGGTTQTVQIMGNGYKSLRMETYDYYCFMGMCAGWTDVLTAESTSETPVKLEFGFSVSATR
jgi:Cys-rich repeat protein